MKQLRPVSLALAILALCSWSAAATACDQHKSKSASATAASVKAADAGSCSYAKTSAVTASASAKPAAAGHACTAEMAANCTAEMAASCAAHKSAKAANASKAAGCCMSKGAKASATTAAVAPGAEKPLYVNVGAGHAGCSDKSAAKVSGRSAHAGCDGCAQFSDCDQTLREMGAVLQVVPLKNGVMYVYTGDASKVRSLQSTMAQRSDDMAMFASAGTSARLCPDCKQLRGAAMSGKLAREVVNIEGGCLTLMTSSDPAVVARIHALAGVASSARAKI